MVILACPIIVGPLFFFFFFFFFGNYFLAFGHHKGILGTVYTTRISGDH